MLVLKIVQKGKYPPRPLCRALGDTRSKYSIFENRS